MPQGGREVYQRVLSAIHCVEVQRTALHWSILRLLANSSCRLRGRMISAQNCQAAPKPDTKVVDAAMRFECQRWQTVPFRWLLQLHVPTLLGSVRQGESADARMDQAVYRMAP